MIQEFNAQILSGLEVEDGVEPGRIREHQVTVGRYLGAPPEDCVYLLDRLCDWLNGEDFVMDVRLGLASSIIKAILAHLLSDHYNRTRTTYYRELDHASRSGGDVTRFVAYAVGGFVDELREQIAEIQRFQRGIAWRDFVNERFAHDPSSAAVRQRELVLELSARVEPVTRNELRALSPRVAQLYARVGDKALSRDLNTLISAELVVRDRGGYRARTEIILAFLPLSER